MFAGNTSHTPTVASEMPLRVHTSEHLLDSALTPLVLAEMHRTNQRLTTLCVTTQFHVIGECARTMLCGCVGIVTMLWSYAKRLRQQDACAVGN
ncbi:unnamed protein product [Mesocestoides corti]|uniref:COPIIcoated_ERV domain-containing protein n=1 Tax=Mesocestoides corti TaxID=53468 RepID=A0A0R3UN70_MESCO|nr:unnamed protein product [Mesocestoides corti]